MLLKGDPWNSGCNHNFIMYCPHCNKREYNGTENPSMKEVKDMHCSKCGTLLVDIDAGMEEIVTIFNKSYIHVDENGKNVEVIPFKTLQCCEGHWESFYKNSTPYITLQPISAAFPLVVFNKLTSADITFDLDMKSFDNKMSYLMYIDGESSLPFVRHLTIRMNTDELGGTMRDEREFPGYSEKVFNRRRRIFLDQLKEFAETINKLYTNNVNSPDDETPIEKYIKTL